ncbi:penicillin-binding protein [Alicyclobacillus fastidiosus]|uniref:Penicillin-binding protein n=1 Tax=Alicyclobacillus fastidiosus TaxID=392011 RepID=A0ABY6ZNW1_9BACL|nr:transglycosylase domain-containing protein [Alicyclobacillus fastidiosus]WAH43625.1 penicillin-binding protein [Alicyclobacillus fastidiosus]GMA59818.1 penicillin-binding protein 1A [Alicyclobacillus fastidiosus]
MGKEQGPKIINKNQDTKAAARANAARAEGRKRHPIWTTAKVTMFGLGSLVVLGVATGAGYVSSMLKGLPHVNASTFQNNRAASIVYDANGKVIGSFKGDGDRQPISSIQQVSTALVNSFVAGEDKTFFTNIGVNPLSMGRAVVQDVLGHKIESGASTITQQTVKLAVFPQQERTVRRKVQEIALALEVNHELSKDEIMTDYMNWVYMGRLGTDPVYGVKRASEIIFQKDPKNLTLPEAAFLAAIPNNPSYFSPYQFPKHTVARQHYILQQMLENHMISQSAYDQAIHFNILKDVHKAPTVGLPAHPYLMLDEIKPRVISALVQAGVYGNATDAESALPTAGLQIHTTIDLKKQDDVENVLQNATLFNGTDKTYKSPNGQTTTDLYEAGVTIIDNQTGAIVAVGGGRDYLKDSYDHADLARQPGSSIKPLLDYGPAIDQRLITAATPLYDAPTHFSLPSGDWNPQDDEDDFVGLMSARDALAQSRNVPAIDILEELTPQVGFSYLDKMGLSPNDKTLYGNPTIVADDANHLSSAIGGLDNGATVEQMTSAYTTFANQGVWHQGYMIQSIDDQTGRTIYTAHPKTSQVFSPATAYIVTDMLHDVLYSAQGTAVAVGSQFPGQYISGKTGTTDNLTDGWFVGYTKQYTAGIWMGYNHHESISPSVYNLKFSVWSDIMRPILKQSPATTPWQRPANVVTESVSSISGQLPTALSTAHGTIETEPFIDGTQPTQQDSVNVIAKYVVIGGVKYLATTNTPPQDVRTGVFIKLPAVPDQAHKVVGGETFQTPYLLPTQADPRGGQVLDAGNTASTSPAQLAAPSQIQGHIQGTSVVLSWKPVTSALHYAIYRSTSANGSYVEVGNTSATSFTDSHLPKGADVVYYVIYAQSNNAMSDASTPFGIQLPAQITPPSGGGGGNTTGNGTGSSTPPTGNGTNSTGAGTGGGSTGSGNSANNTSTGETTGDTHPRNSTSPKVDWMPGVGIMK